MYVSVNNSKNNKYNKRWPHYLYRKLWTTNMKIVKENRQTQTFLSLGLWKRGTNKKMDQWSCSMIRVGLILNSFN